jgi:organic radical activating enzyme
MALGQADEENCAACITQERLSGAASLRSYYNTYYAQGDQTDTKLAVIDLRWNNTCNLACVYCSHVFSSTWADRSGIINLKPVKLYQDSLLEWILKQVDDVREIMLVGGEPMLMKQNYALLRKLPQDCQISIITNLSYDLSSLPCMDSLLARPAGKVLWNISAENTEKKFEYVRSGASWTKFQNNLVFLTEKFPESQSINMVYNLLSAFDLPDTVGTFMDHGIKKFVLQPLEGKPGLDVFKMPAAIRAEAAARLRLTVEKHAERVHVEDVDLYPINLAHKLLDQLINQSSDEIVSRQDFLKQIARADRWNQNKFADLWPDLDRMIQQHLE